jgi:predicted dehydrogenase
MTHLDADAPARLLVIGAGSRGSLYAAWCLDNPAIARVAAVADPHDVRRNRMADAHDIVPEHRFTDWRDALAGVGPWDAVIVATPDRLHVPPTLRALELGNDVLLEKPIAPTEEEVSQVAAAARHSEGTVTVSHVLRYTPFFIQLRQIIREGRIGELQGIQHTENIGFWHFAHSYVRGNWHNAERSSPLLLAKSCHDLDILRWLVDAPFTAVSSFGSLRHFRPENAPPGSTERCIDGCAVAPTCPYNAERLYIEQLAGIEGFPVSAISTDTSPEGRRRALTETDYGRCVYRMDNDVVDHQTTALQFANGVTASLIVSAFTPHVTRTVTVMGSRGQIDANMITGKINVIEFLDTVPKGDVAGQLRRFETTSVDDVEEVLSGHGGGDEAMMSDFTARIQARKAGRDVDDSRSSLAQSLESHYVAFAAERARLNGTVETL